MVKMVANAKMAVSIFVLLLGISNSIQLPKSTQLIQTPWKTLSDYHLSQAKKEVDFLQAHFLRMNRNNHGKVLAVDDKPENLESDSKLPLDPLAEDNISSDDMASTRPR